MTDADTLPVGNFYDRKAGGFTLLDLGFINFSSQKLTVAEKRNIGSGIIRRSSGKRGLNHFTDLQGQGVLRRP